MLRVRFDFRAVFGRVSFRLVVSKVGFVDVS